MWLHFSSYWKTKLNNAAHYLFLSFPLIYKRQYDVQNIDEYINRKYKNIDESLNKIDLEEGQIENLLVNNPKGLVDFF